MGTYGIQLQGTVKQTMLKELASENSEIIDCSFQSDVAYFAIKTKRTGEVYALVCTLRRGKVFGRPGLYYKPMEEDMVPYYWSCPERILNKLTPTNSVEANRWREANRRHQAYIAKCKEFCKVLIAGDKLGDQYTFIRWWKKGTKYPLIVSYPNGQLVRISEEIAYIAAHPN